MTVIRQMWFAKFILFSSCSSCSKGIVMASFIYMNGNSGQGTCPLL